MRSAGRRQPATTQDAAAGAGVHGEHHLVSPRTVGRLLNEAGYSLQSNHKTMEDDAHPDRRALHDAVDRLPREQREAIRLLKLKQLSLNEAEAESGTSVAALKVATHRALKNLRKLMASKDDAT